MIIAAIYNRIEATMGKKVIPTSPFLIGSAVFIASNK
jgi:hypothetical protein